MEHSGNITAHLMEIKMTVTLEIIALDPSRRLILELFLKIGTLNLLAQSRVDRNSSCDL